MKALSISGTFVEAARPGALFVLPGQSTTCVFLTRGWAGKGNDQNNVQFVDPSAIETLLAFYDQAFGGRSARAVLIWFLIRSRNLVLSLRAAPTNARRRALFFNLMLLHGTLISGDVKRGFLAFRSHADGLAHGGVFPDDVITRNFVKAYPSHRRAIRRQLRILIENGPSNPQQVEWIDVVRRLKGKAEHLVGAGHRYPLVAEGPLSQAGVHKHIAQSIAFKNFMTTDPRFQVTRLVCSSLYLLSYLGGISLWERAVLCQMAAAAAEEEFGLNFERMIEEFDGRETN
ncbi:hypothetical protein ACC794_02975 [Rhizobium ruizarguesonis]